MEADEHAARIKILHVHSPHLLWVEFYANNNQKCKWRQIGLFGVVPSQHAEKGGEVVSTVGEQWDPAVNEAIMNFASKCGYKLYFKGVYSDDETGHSIFHSLPHLFGEITGVKNNHHRQLSTHLQAIGFACSSKKMFFQMLTSSKIQTLVNENEIKNLLQKIIDTYQTKGTWLKAKKYINSCLQPQYANVLKNLEVTLPTLTAENLELLQKKTCVENQSRMEKMSNTDRKHKGSPKVDLSHDVSENYEHEKNYVFEKPVIKPLQFIEEALEKHLGITTAPENTSHNNGDYTKIKTILKMAPSESGMHITEKITLYDDELHEIDTEGKLNETDSTYSADSPKALGRANHRMVSNPYKTKLDPYEEEKKFQYLMKLKESAKQRTKKREGSIESQPEKADSQDIEVAPQNGKVKCSGRQDWMEHTPRQQKNRSRLVQDSEDNDDADNEGSSILEKEVDDRLIAYGPPMCDWKKFVVKKRQDQGANIMQGNTNIYEDFANMESTWTEKNVDSEDEEQNNVGKLQAVQINEVFNTNTGKQSLKIHEADYKDFENREQIISRNKKQRGTDCLEIMVKSKQLTKEILNISQENCQISIVKENIITKTEENSAKSKVMASSRMRKFLKLNDSYSSSDDTKSQREREQKLEGSSSNDINSASSSKDVLDSDDDDDDLAKVQAKLNAEYKPFIIKPKPKREVQKVEAKINVNPFKNLDDSQSVFVENLVAPLLLAHTKNENLVKPRNNLRDIPFRPEILTTLQNMQVKAPSRLQTVSWAYILRGHSVFMIGAPASGKTLGYLPAVCNLVMDYNFDIPGRGPICIIVCATALSVANVAKASKMFLNHERVVSCYPGIDSMSIVTKLLNGCDMLVSTPSMLCRLLGVELGVDLRRLTTLVFDDCERLADVYESEVKAVQIHVKQMLKTRADKQIKVQYVLASRLWCSFMHKLAKRAPDTIVTFGTFQECVLYSKTNTTVSFVKNDKINAVVEFLKEVDDSKLTVVVCRADDEVELLEKRLKTLNYTVLACNNQMTIHDLYKIRSEEYFYSVMICCDGNLSMLNVTHATYLVHFSMPALYSQFCARFSVLNDNYASVFGPPNNSVKIKILLEETNVEQLPKILAFVKRCIGEVPEGLVDISRKVLEQKDLKKAQRLVPVCESLMTFGKCVDERTHCQERHAILGQFDSPKDWVPYYGYITFKITHYHSAVSYSARLLTHEAQNGTVKYPDYYHKLTMNLGIYFGNEKNKRLHGDPKIGDIGAVIIRQNFAARCQVLKIMSGEKDKAKKVLVMMLDEEKLEIVRAVELYHLPDEFKTVETHIVKVRLANIQPQDKDLTFPEHAQHKLEKITDGNDKLYLRSRVIMAIGNSIFVDSLVACENLSDSKTVVKEDFKELLLETLALPNPDHVLKLKKLCEIGNFTIRDEPQVKTRKSVRKKTEHRWAHLDKDDWSEVIITNTVNAGKFYVTLQKFEKCVSLLISDIKKYVNDNLEPVESISVGDIVLAEFPDDAVYERAIIQEVIDETNVLCFFADTADCRKVSTEKLRPIPEKLIKQIPFQAIQCRLIGVKPPGQGWPEFSSNWLDDNCLENGDLKRLYVKYCTKEKAEVTSHKYGVVLVDTTTEKDVVINKRMIEMNLAAVDESEYDYLKKPLDFTRVKTDTSSVDEDSEPELKNASKNANGPYLESENMKTKFEISDKPVARKGLIRIPVKLIPKTDDGKKNITNKSIQKRKDEPKKTIDLKNGDEEVKDKIVQYKEVPRKSINTPGKLIRSVPLVSDSDEDSDKWDVCFSNEFTECFGLASIPQPNEEISNTSDGKSNDTLVTVKRSLPAIVNAKEDNNTEKNPVETEAIDYKQTKIVDMREDVLHEMLKNKSFYDSDSTLSISDGEDIEEVTTKVSYSDDFLSGSIDKNENILNNNNKEQSFLDSDDTSVANDAQSYLTSDIVEVVAQAAIKCSDEINVDGKPILESPVTKQILQDNFIADNKVFGSLREPLSKSADKDVNEITKTVKNKSANEIKSKTITITESTEPARKPQLTWKQDRHFVTIKIKVIGVETYSIETIGNRSLKFEAYQDEVRYAFDIELYGVIENGCTHANKGQYIVVTLRKMKTKSPTWVKLTKGSFKNWIVYDVDSIENDSSSDDDAPNELARKLIMNSYEEAIADDRDEMDDMPDDTGFQFRDDD